MPQVNCRTVATVHWNSIFDRTDDLTTTAHIWRLRISFNAELVEPLYTLLSSAEKDRAGSYHHSHDRSRFILSRGALRMLLAAYTAISPAEIQLIIGKNKKPLPTHSGDVKLHYNLAHAGDFIVLIFSATPSGIDIERINDDFDYTDVLGDCFSAEEQSFLNNHSSPRLAFYQLWTRKEALAKATSTGIDDTFRLVPSLDGQHEVAGAAIGSEKNWNITSMEVSDGYPAAIACESSIASLLFFEADQLLRCF